MEIAQKQNTFVLAFYNIVFFFPLPIVIALMLNELRLELFKQMIQTIVYIPHFMSWVSFGQKALALLFH